MNTHDHEKRKRHSWFFPLSNTKHDAPPDQTKSRGNPGPTLFPTAVQLPGREQQSRQQQQQQQQQQQSRGHQKRQRGNSVDSVFLNQSEARRDFTEEEIRLMWTHCPNLAQLPFLYAEARRAKAAHAHQPCRITQVHATAHPSPGGVRMCYTFHVEPFPLATCTVL